MSDSCRSDSFRRVLTCVLLAAVAACASGGGGGSRRSDSPFPTRAQVDALTNGSGAINPFAQAVVDAKEWTFSEPAAERLDDEPYVDSSLWGPLLMQFVASDPSRLQATRAMHCTASELARFYLEYAAMPAPPLRSAILEHCGALVADIYPSYVFGAATQEHSEEMLHYDWKSKVRAVLNGYVRPGAQSLGIAFARDEKKAVVVMVAGARRAQIEPTSRVVGADGRLVIRGRSLTPVARVSAFVNQGRYAFASCTPDTDLRLPEFGYACPLAAGDASARVTVVAFERGRLLGLGVLDLEALRESPPATYRRTSYTPPAPVRDVAEAPPRLLELVNEVRRQAHVPPVSLSETETAVSARLAPHFFEAFLDVSKHDAADALMLGLMAGWDVGGEPIRTAGFTAGAVGPTDDASDWIAAIMSDPTGRATLLEPSARVVAFGPVMTQSPAILAATFTSYSFFDTADYAAVRDQLLEKIRAERAARGLPPPILVTTLDEDAAPLAAELRSGRETPNEALTSLMRTGATVLGRSVHGLAFQGTTFDEIELPDELLTARRLELSITVSHYRPEGSPWGSFVALVVIPGEGTRA